jgi:hypothetical protein
MYRFVAHERGVRFAAGFAAVQLLINIAIVAGVAGGVVQWALSASFRGLYDGSPRPIAPIGQGASA